ncbi:hypothetical protein OsJ_06768 [Oryza sativa Japonica Group]|uniref:Uncharacterized protein n=1 Tax=Oryza sativa subsp. japonica TaxID=39947 RepID=B9F016_ORYSJ|nr:hypothetical protein OsJ_06768 [Oryza sativa Japonica Group]
MRTMKTGDECGGGGSEWERPRLRFSARRRRKGTTSWVAVNCGGGGGWGRPRLRRQRMGTTSAPAATGDGWGRPRLQRRRMGTTSTPAAADGEAPAVAGEDLASGSGFAGGGGRGKDGRRGASSGQRDSDDGGRAMMAAAPDLEESVAMAICGGVCGRSAGGEVRVWAPMWSSCQQGEGDAGAGGWGGRRIKATLGRRISAAAAVDTEGIEAVVERKTGERGTLARLRSAGSERCGSDMSHWIRQSDNSYSACMIGLE